MIFLGKTFCGARNTIDRTSTNVSSIDSFKIKNGIYDDLYISKNTNRIYETTIPTVWNFDSLLYATFENSLNAGNVDFTLDQVSSIRIKRREKGTFNWITLFEIIISDENDFYFEKFDRYARSNIEYEYASIPVLNGVEGLSYNNSVLSEFEGLAIIEKEVAFKTILEVNLQSQKNRPNTIVNTIDRKFPFVVSNGMNNYYSGSANGLFVETDYTTGQFKTENGWAYRDQLMEFLQNGKPKILKHYDGRMWLVAIVGDPSEQVDGHPDKVITYFEWVEVGDCNSSRDLYDNNFIDVDV